MTRLLTILLLAGVAIGVPYFLLRHMGKPRGTLFAYTMGFLASGMTSVSVFLATQAILPEPVLNADSIFGSGLACALVGPALGAMAGKRVRARAQARATLN